MKKKLKSLCTVACLVLFAFFILLGATDLSEVLAILLVALVLGLAAWWVWSMEPRSWRRQSEKNPQASAYYAMCNSSEPWCLMNPIRDQRTALDFCEPVPLGRLIRVSILVEVDVCQVLSRSTESPPLSPERPQSLDSYDN